MKNIILYLLLFFNPFSARAEIHLYGDSVFTTSWRQFGKELSRLSREKLLDHSVQGAWMSQIRDQYLAARAPKGSTVVFDGGGNDIFGNSWSCRNTPSDYCKDLVNRAVVTFSSMLDLMAQDEVKEVIFMGAHYPAKQNAGYNAVIDYTYPRIKEVCETRSFCHFVDVRSLLKDGDLEWDGIHPNTQGLNKLARAVYDPYIKH